jgi:Fe2+ transport system protein FeoA
LYGRRELLEEMPPFLGGGDMISRVDWQESRWNSLPWKFEAGTSPYVEATGLGAAIEWLAGLGIDAVHAEADRLEHVISEELEARIDEQLGYPTHDPHGDPIPDAGLNLDPTALRSLDALELGEAATVRRIPDGDAGLLRYLATLKVVPGQKVTLRRSEPFGGPLTVDVDGSEHAISRELAGLIGVSG